MIETSAGTEMRKYDFIETKEQFLKQHYFSDTAKGLFYVGAMMYQIGQMQYHQGHKNKPILEKVIYNGMNTREIMELIGELQDKLRQYRKAMEAKQKGYLVFCAEKYSSEAYKYLGNLPMSSTNNDQENIFYLMSGYSSCIPVNKAGEESTNDYE